MVAMLLFMAMTDADLIARSVDVETTLRSYWKLQFIDYIGFELPGFDIQSIR